ncbi:hypothetical protein DFP72DRAFT_1061442 [Ephemerocybe angulata]|uniref:Uncharacterized protein n=1 Tax=Ephemerocybe angulata TaxID=980116 RepID=A0A8H6IAW9_9AGAR|nr:hypothetical protein DFP72DRAFT_1061442 [Tulosesus angulatus]
MSNTGALLDAFRSQYHSLVSCAQTIFQNNDDSNILARLGDQVDEYLRALAEHRHIFDEAEFTTIHSNILHLQSDVQNQYRDLVDQSHHGFPVVIEQVRTGRPGRPSYRIDPGFLETAYNLRSTAGTARFLGVSRGVVRAALLNHGIAAPQINPFPEASRSFENLEAAWNSEIDGNNAHDAGAIDIGSTGNDPLLDDVSDFTPANEGLNSIKVYEWKVSAPE